MRNRPKLINNLSFVGLTLLKKPELLARSGRFLLQRMVGRPVIRGMDMALTYRCNLACGHCNAAGVQHPGRKELTVAEAAAVIDQLKAIGGFYVTFTGGEILLDLDRLETILRAVGEKSLLFQIQTNGVLLNDRICGRLRKMGIDNIQVSFDAFHETANWREVVRIKEEQVRLLRRWGFGVIFTWLASHSTLAGHEIADVVQFARTHRVKVGLNFAVPQGRWSNAGNFLLDRQDSIRIRRIAENNPYLYTDLQNNMLNFGCPAFSERLHVNAYGDVQPCTFFQIGFGNVRTEPLAAIWRRGRQFPLFANFPDHCPPAENPFYLKRWFELIRTDVRLPVPYTDFFAEVPGEPWTKHAALFAGVR